MKLPSPTGWSPRLLAALLRGSLPSVHAQAPEPGRPAAEPIIPWRGDSYEPRSGRRMLGGADAERRTPYALEDDAGPARPRRPGRGAAARAQAFPWEELARLRGARDADSRPDAGDRPRETDRPPDSVATAPHPPPVEPRAAMLAPPAVSHRSGALGWSLTAPGGRRPARAVPAMRRPASVWRWAPWIVAVAIALRYLGAL